MEYTVFKVHVSLGGEREHSAGANGALARMANV